MESYQFNDKGMKFHLSVHPDFLKVCPNPSAYDYKALLEQFNMFAYLHNTTGPAVHRIKDGKEEYWVYERDEHGNMKPSRLDITDPDAVERIKHAANFKKKLEEVLND